MISFHKISSPLYKLVAKSQKTRRDAGKQFQEESNRRGFMLCKNTGHQHSNNEGDETERRKGPNS